MQEKPAILQVSLLLLHIKHSMSVVTQICKLKYPQDLLKATPTEWHQKTILYVMTYLTVHFPFCIHQHWNTWSTHVNIQYANLEDKEITQISHLL